MAWPLYICKGFCRVGNLYREYDELLSEDVNNQLVTIIVYDTVLRLSQRETVKESRINRASGSIRQM